MSAPHVRQDLLEIAANYAEFCVLVTSAALDKPGPQILYVNSAFTRMTGYSVQDMLGNTPRMLQGPDTDQALLKQLRDTLEAGHDFIARTTNYKRSGESFEIEWIISHLRDVNGRATHYIAVQRDVTGLHRAEDSLLKYDDELRTARTRILADAERLRQAEKALEEKRKVSLLGEMAAGVVHDISNALTPVYGLVQTLHGIDNLPPMAKRLSESMDSSMEHALQVLSNLRAYYYDPNRHEYTTIDLMQLVKKLPDVTSAKRWDESLAQRGNYDFSISAQSGVLVKGNEIELLQVLVNIVLNALDAMPDGGTITVTLRAECNLAVLSIADTGSGMDSETAAACFEPYVTRRSAGAGLGLAVCRRIIEAHGGDIQMQANSPEGVTFTVSLPLIAPEIETTANFEGNVLIVGGNTCDQRRLLEAVQGLAMQIHATEVHTGDEALQALHTGIYDCVIIDTAVSPVHVFDMTGFIRKTRPGTKVLWWLSTSEYNAALLADPPCLPDGIIDSATLEADLRHLL